ncbi:SURF1 family protein [Crenobacter sp. SG2303]|uniref:SURF1-like protein n=1 Tax=Crenobacter oryzisoli TaxID=3056844 RepID=A0ABT7XLK8_9NEIS|nr:SURF1 family protein [Crenobacter sp. SG2303]MDN0074671.1 SURF1 family protein [Crenobacter sp. SG2303]
MVWLLSLIALLPFALAVWQWQRGQERAATLVQFDQLTRHGVLALAELPLDAYPGWQPVWLRGQAVGPVILLNNVYRDDQPGVRVIQVMKLADNSAVLVERGWLPVARAGESLPPLSGEQTGRWLPMPQHFTLPGAVHGVAGRVDVLDTVELATRLGVPLRQGLVALSQVEPPLAALPSRPQFSPQRHYAYALQWLLLGLCLCAAAITLWRRRHA